MRSERVRQTVALHQRARNVTRTDEVRELREGVIEVVDDVL
jgi:hypothetical protein